MVRRDDRHPELRSRVETTIDALDAHIHSIRSTVPCHRRPSGRGGTRSRADAHGHRSSGLMDPSVTTGFAGQRELRLCRCTPR